MKTLWHVFLVVVSYIAAFIAGVLGFALLEYSLEESEPGIVGRCFSRVRENGKKKSW